ncbi:hypothetical protein B7494_g4685 [Chlorociboria aeruginascens]|nr:hypothetical protein B7494_g4685 [Chlorociboria aeruginascens]
MASGEAEMPWHAGEEAVQRMLHVPRLDNPTSLFLSPYAANLLVRSPLLALGALDSKSRPWTTIWGGKAGFSRAVSNTVIGLQSTVDRSFDPVLETLLGTKADGEVVRDRGPGRMVGGLAIDLETRRRVKLYGRMVAGSLVATERGAGEVQMAVKIEQSLGNCPKYLNKKHVIPHIPQPKLVSKELPLPQQAIDLIAKADLFFISSSNHDRDMDTNHRGGPPGFVRILSNDESGLVIVYPEYSGNRLYQTLGNLNTTPLAGLVFPDFDTGDVLYITGTTEILAGEKAANLIAHTNLAVKIRVEAARFVSEGLPFRGVTGEFSPYNPPVRYLSTEERLGITSTEKMIYAKLINRKILTPDIGCFRFRIADPQKTSKWRPGQYVALSFKNELDIGYSHMRDDDPKSLNDDFSRTFTVSSPKPTTDTYDEFEITVRKVGPATEHLFQHNLRDPLDVPILGFGGEFFIKQDSREHIAFIAGGVGITPLLAQIEGLDMTRFQLLWMARSSDLALVLDTFTKYPGLAKATRLFVTGRVHTTSESWQRLEASEAKLTNGRITSDDFAGLIPTRWYLCTGPTLRNSILKWLEGKTVVYEDFNY